MSLLLFAGACGPSELALGLPEAPGMGSGLMGILGPESASVYTALYALDLETRAGLETVRGLQAGPEASPVVLELLLFGCELEALGLAPGPVALSPDLEVEPPPAECRFEVRLDQEVDLVRWQPVSEASAALRGLRYASREPTCSRDVSLHRCHEL